MRTSGKISKIAKEIPSDTGVKVPESSANGCVFLLLGKRVRERGISGGFTLANETDKELRNKKTGETASTVTRVGSLHDPRFLALEVQRFWCRDRFLSYKPVTFAQKVQSGESTAQEVLVSNI